MKHGSERTLATFEHEDSTGTHPASLIIKVE